MNRGCSVTQRGSLLAVVVSVFLAGLSCNRDALGPPEDVVASPAAIRALPAYLRVPGYDEDVDGQYGVPMTGMAVTAVRYRLGPEFPPTEFYLPTITVDL